MILVDSNVLLDIFTQDPDWYEWSAQAIEYAANESSLAIDPLIYAEISVRFKSIEDLDLALPASDFVREPLPYEAAFLAAKAFHKYRRRGGSRTTPMPDFYIGAHAAVCNYKIITRDPRRFRMYFPTVQLITPKVD